MQKVLLILMLGCVSCYASGQVSLNINVDTLEPDAKAALSFLRSYIQEFRNDNKPDFSKYWREDDRKKYQYPDQMIYAISSDYPTYEMGERPSVLYVKPTPDYVQIKTLFSRPDSTGLCTYAITNHYVENIGGRLYFIDPLKMNTSGWGQTTLRNVTWHYPPYHHFDAQRADSLINSIIALEKAWKLEPVNIRYYFADTKDEMKKVRGFDYTFDMGNREKPTGISNDVDNLIYCHGLGENYFHEVVHIYLNRLFPKAPLLEGLAVFYGGSTGRSLDWHLKRVNAYLNEHTEIDIGDWEKLHTNYLDNYTNLPYAVKGLLCKLAYDKDGIRGLKRLMNYQSVDDIFNTEFHVKPERRNEFLREKIAANN